MKLDKIDVEEMVDFFGTVSRQCVSQYLEQYRRKGDSATVEKIEHAKKIIKSLKKAAKPKRERTDAQKQRKKAQSLWRAMLYRCDQENFLKCTPNAYVGCSVSDEFKVFDKFFKWVSTQPGFMQDNYQLDKDIIHKGNKVYSSDTCVFVPVEINKLFIRCQKGINTRQLPVGVQKQVSTKKPYVAYISTDGKVKRLGSAETVEEAFAMYKAAKETQIKSIAEKYKEEISPALYDILLNYKVEISD